MSAGINLLQLPDEVIGKAVLECLTAKDLAQIALVSKRFKALASDNGLWMKLIYLDFDAQSDAKNLGFASCRRSPWGFTRGYLGALERSQEEEKEKDNVEEGVIGQEGSDASVRFGESMSLNPIFGRLNNAGVGLPDSQPSYTAQGEVANVKSLLSRDGPEEIFSAKEQYANQLQKFRGFRTMKNQQRVLRAERLHQLKRKRAIKTLLILYNDKLFHPLLFLLLHASTIVLAFWLDGIINSSLWLALTPIWLIYAMTALSWICFFILLERRAQQSILRGMVFEIGGPVFRFTFNVCGHTRLGISTGFAAFLCLPIFTCLATAAVETQLFDFTGAWSLVVLSPIWVLLLILLASPMFQWPFSLRNTNEYAVMLLMCWVPMTAFCILLCLRLEHVVHLPVIFMLAPVWMVLVSVHVGLLLGLFCAIYKNRETAREAVLKLLVLVSIEAPFVSFTILLGLKDAALLDLSYAVVFSPLIAMFSFQCTMHTAIFLAHPRVDLPNEREPQPDINLSLDIWRRQLIQGNPANRRRRASIATTRNVQAEVNITVADDVETA